MANAPAGHAFAGPAPPQLPGCPSGRVLFSTVTGQCGRFLGPGPPPRHQPPPRGFDLPSPFRPLLDAPAMTHWQCIAGCGACCRLDPAQRGDDLDRLDPDQRRTYLEMVGADGWCLHFDTGARRCRIYDSRPAFCRVENLVTLFGSPEDGAAAAATSAAGLAGDGSVAAPGAAAPALDAAGQELAIGSCRTQIRAEYGGRGRVMRRFERAIRRQP